MLEYPTNVSFDFLILNIVVYIHVTWFNPWEKFNICHITVEIDYYSWFIYLIHKRYFCPSEIPKDSFFLKKCCHVKRSDKNLQVILLINNKMMSMLPDIWQSMKICWVTDCYRLIKKKKKILTYFAVVCR